MQTELQEGKYKFWDITIKAVSSLLGVITIIIALISYLGNQKTELKQKEREYRKDLATRQVNYYAELSHSLGELVTLLDYPDSLMSPTYRAKKENYNTLYYGKMNLIESKEVANNLQNFYGMLESFEVDDTSVTREKLKKAVFKINDAFRISIMETYDVKLDKLTK